MGHGLKFKRKDFKNMKVMTRICLTMESEYSLKFEKVLLRT